MDATRPHLCVMVPSLAGLALGLFSSMCQVAWAQPAAKPLRGSTQELPPMVSSGAPGIIELVPGADPVPRYGRSELTIRVSASYDNPFDPEQVDLSADFVSPSKRSVTAHGFYYQAYKNVNEGDDSKTPMLEAVGMPCWKVRFAPTETGTYTYTVRLRNRFGKVDEEVSAGAATFRCVDSSSRGFIRVSRSNHRHFQFDDGTPFFAVGQNLQNDWPRYQHFRRLAAAGCNAVRIWPFCHWTWLEWTFKPGISWARTGHWMRSYAGAGKYNQRIAWIADHHVAQCERDGLRLMLCLGNGTGGGELSKATTYGCWGGHPYSVKNGGFLDEPVELWTHDQARRLYKQRLRYIVARYGYSTSVWAWEFWNELGQATPQIVAWHREMGDYIRRIDPNRHLVTTSTWVQSPQEFTPVWSLPQMDFTQTHIYQGPQIIRRRVGWALRDHPDKPHIIGEGGGHFPGEDGSVDPQGIDFHNSLWAGAVSGAAGTTLPWYWRRRIEPRNLFSHYTAVAKFVKDVPWATTKLEPVSPLAVVLLSPQPEPRFSPVMVVPGGTGWGSKPRRNRFLINGDGSVPHVDDLSAALFGSGRAAWRNPPTMQVSCPAAGRLTVYVAETSHAILEVALDGELVLRDDSLNVSRAQVRKSIDIDVPAGKHEIEFRNAGSDWLRIGYILLTHYRDTTRYPDLNVYGVQSDSMALFWVHNRLNEWSFRAAGINPQPVGSAMARPAGLADGNYRVEWWDTYTGAITRTETVTCSAGVIDLRLPVVETDVACIVRRSDE